MTALPRLILLTDRSQLRLGRGLARTITECVDAGLTHVVVREHDLPAPARHALVGALVGVPGLTVISSRIPDPAAHGLHLPAHAHPAGHFPTGSNAGLWSLNTRQNTCEATITPRYSGGGGLVGRSCHTAAEVRRAADDGADYVTLSPFATTPSKPGYGPPLAAEAYAGHGVPVYALGGITSDNAAGARDAGAHGVAVMGEIMRAGDPAATVARLLEVVG
ncbi:MULTISPECIES: thiamine phosphate synthase [unclassified Nocardioides]|uniref:thiamine phosphate synthase n=1 Tax=unclassified Nocardioides TaxID=2615069 RepID=UPI0006FA84BA|nr:MULTISPECIES: thiamine phosphate synthase [unclassified Nocardioides]KQY56382.1 hypothetical protein ASD30_08530 [Nocardioides sp. Root140]KRF14245.1 hypothetical protein ASH02_07790 [Nocardioides sp. Soil796]